jgi:hypothetical protein
MPKRSISQDQVASRIVELLDEIADLMKGEPAVDRRALEYLIQLQGRMRFLSLMGDHPVAMPTKAPTRWLDRKDRSETPIDFIRREYAEWLGRGLSRPHIRQLDKSLYAALTNWISENGELPSDFDLPTKKELNDRKLAEIGYEVRGPSDQQREALRLYHAARRRTPAKR